MVQLRQYDLAKGEARDRPWQLISDLHSASATCMWPSIRVELNLEPDSKRPDETRGTVVLKVGLFLCSMQQVLRLVVHASVDRKSVKWSRLGSDWFLYFCCHLLASCPCRD